MGAKYFCWNIDDGLEQDKRITEYFRRCGIGATFNLNSGIMGERGMIGRIGDMGFKNVRMDTFDPKRPQLFMKYAPASRIPADEVRQVYEGFETASHGLHHENLRTAPEAEARQSVLQDVENLSALFETKIIGFAYAFGMEGKHTVQDLKDAGIRYARTTRKSEDFKRPADPYHLPMTAWHNERNVFEKIDAFLAAEAGDEDLFFLMFGHGYEFDFGTKNSNWDKFRRICDRVAGAEGVRCVSTAEGLGLV